jgi:hypothetical protein
MTSEEMERAIEFLLQSQAKQEAQQTKTSEQLSQLARTHVEFTEFVRSNLAAQSQLNTAQSEMNQSLRETVRALTVKQARTDERLSDIEAGSEGKA